MEKKSKIKKYRGCLIKIEDLKIFKQSIKYALEVKRTFLKMGNIYQRTNTYRQKKAKSSH